MGTTELPPEPSRPVSEPSVESRAISESLAARIGLETQRGQANLARFLESNRISQKRRWAKRRAAEEVRNLGLSGERAAAVMVQLEEQLFAGPDPALLLLEDDFDRPIEHGDGHADEEGSTMSGEERFVPPPADPPTWYVEGDGISINGDRVALRKSSKLLVEIQAGVQLLRWVDALPEPHEPRYLPRVNLKGGGNSKDARSNLERLAKAWGVSLADLVEHAPHRGDRLRVPRLPPAT